MPILPTYTATKSDLPIAGGRRADAADFYSGSPSGAVLQKVAGDYEDNLSRDEARQAVVRSAEIRAKYAKLIDEAETSGGDLGKLKEQMSAELSSVGENFQTKQGRDQMALYTANANLMYDEQANRINAQRAYVKARTDGQNVINSSGAVLLSNPAYLPEAIRTFDDYVATFNLKPAQAAELKKHARETMTAMSLHRQIQDDPAGMRKRIEAGGFPDLSPEQAISAAARAKQEENGQRIEKERVKAVEREAREERISGAQIQLFNLAKDNKLTWATVRDHPDLQGSDKHTAVVREHMAAIIEARAKRGEGEDKKGVYNDAWLNVRSGSWKTPDKITELVAKGQLTPASGDRLLAIQQAAKDETGESVSRKASARFGLLRRGMSEMPEFKFDQTGEKLNSVMIELQSQFDQKEKEIRSANDPKRPIDGMFDPKSADYFFKDGIVKSAVRDVQQRQVDALKSSLPLVRGTTDDELVAQISSLGLKEGQQFLTARGDVATVTKAIAARVAKAGKTASGAAPAVVPSGEKWPHDVPMPLATYKYRKAMGLPINKNLTVIDDNGERVADPDSR